MKEGQNSLDEKIEAFAEHLHQALKQLYPARQEMVQRVIRLAKQREAEALKQQLGSGDITEEPPESGRTFKQAADQFLIDYLVEHPGKRLPRYIESKLRNHLLPFFGAKDLSMIRAESRGDYCEYRRRTGRDRTTDKPKQPAAVTLRIELQLFERVLETAQRHGWFPPACKPAE